MCSIFVRDFSILSWLPSLQNFNVAFTMLCTYPVKKLSRFARSKYFSKIGQDGGENISADQDNKVTAFIPYLSRPDFKLLSGLLQHFGHMYSVKKIDVKSAVSLFVFYRKVRSVSRMLYGISGVERVTPLMVIGAIWRPLDFREFKKIMKNRVLERAFQFFVSAFLGRYSSCKQ